MRLPTARSPITRARVCCVLLSAAAIPLAACGGGSDATAQFTSGYESLRQPLNHTGDAIGAAVQNAARQSDEQVHATFARLAQRWQAEVSKLEGLKPPDRFATEFHAVTDDATRVSSDLDAIVTAAATHSPSAATQASTSLGADATALQTATTMLRRRLGIR